MAHTKEAKDQMIAFITANSQHLTLIDMTEELASIGANYNLVRDLCRKLNIKPISIMEQSKKFILEFYERKTAAQLAKNLNMCEANVYRICKTLNIYPLKKGQHPKDVPLTPPPQIRRKTKSAGKILSEFKMANVPHYFSPTQYLAQIKEQLGS